MSLSSHQMRLPFPVSSVEAAPQWTRYEKPFWWRRDRLQQAAEALGKSMIMHTKTDYPKTVEVSAKARDKFYRDHIREALGMSFLDEVAPSSAGEKGAASCSSECR